MSTQAQYIRTHLGVEDQIIRCLQNKDKHGISLIYENYSAVLLNVILRVVGNREIAEDVLQEVLIKIWKKADTFNSSKGSLYTWMVQVSRNAAIDKTRTKDFRLTEESKDAADLVSLSNQIVQESNMESAHLRQSIDRLPEHQRKLIDLAYFYGYTHQETSQNLGIPLGTVKTRIRLAIKQLRDWI